MRFYFWILITAALLFSSCSSGDGDGDTTTPPPTGTDWSLPACTSLTGSNYLGFSVNGGADLVDSNHHILPATSVFAFGLITLGQNTLLANVDGEILRSTNAGCTWAKLGTLSAGGLYALVAAGANGAYAYSYTSPIFYKLDLQTSTWTALQAPEPISTMWVNSQNNQDVRITAHVSQQPYRSSNGGSSFTAMGAAASGSSLHYFSAFDASNPDHLIQGSSWTANGNRAGLFVSQDGGLHWTQAQGFGNARTNFFRGAISAANPNIVWALGLDVDGAAERRKIYYSSDGGFNYQAVLTASPEVALSNGTQLWADPRQPGHLVFSISEPDLIIPRQSYIYEYQHEASTLTRHPHPYEEVGQIYAIAFNPSRTGNLFFTKSFAIHGPP